MPITRQEERTRQLVAAIHERGEPKKVDDLETIRAEALAEFTRGLDAKLANLRNGERLLLTYRIDIMARAGEIRSGSGTTRTMPEYAEWRTAVYTRDDYTCRECGERGELNAHHIYPWAAFPSLRFEVANGLTLCVPCHARKHPHLGFNHGKTEEVH